jgi:microsomal epoxide hydrolase
MGALRLKPFGHVHCFPCGKQARGVFMTVDRFEIRIAQDVLDDLRERLQRTRWPENKIAEADWRYGVDVSYLKPLIRYWFDKYDWRAQEAALNRFAHFRANIDDLRVHFIHERGRGPQPMPLVLTHGWPDSFVHMLKVIPLLTDPAAHGGDAKDSFDVIVPSLPGFGFSEKPKQVGATARVADYWAQLLTDELGYKRFGAAGGDLGGRVTQQLAQQYPERLIGIHLTDVPFQNALFFSGDDRSKLTRVEQEYFQRMQEWSSTQGAYAAVQSTKPQMAACGLNDSPAGLAAWIIAQFQPGSDCNGDLESRFTKDELLTHVMIYWLTQTISSSFLHYYEPAHGHTARDMKKFVETPTGFALFPKDLNPAPREWAERFFTVRRWSEMPRGGHFAALEEPQWFVEEIRQFFRPLRPA